MKSGEGICGEEDSAEGVAIGQGTTITTERANCVKGADSYHMAGLEGAGRMHGSVELRLGYAALS